MNLPENYPIESVWKSKATLEEHDMTSIYQLRKVPSHFHHLYQVGQEASRGDGYQLQKP